MACCEKFGVGGDGVCNEKYTKYRWMDAIDPDASCLGGLDSLVQTDDAVCRARMPRPVTEACPHNDERDEWPKGLVDVHD